MIIDAHVHAGPLLAAAPTPTICDASTGEALIRLLDRAGIDLAVVFAPPWKGGIEDPNYETSNLAVSSMQRRFPDRILGAARVSPNFGRRAVDEARRCFEVYGLRALKLNPDWDSFRMAGNATVLSLLDLASAMRRPVVVHCGDFPRSQPAAFLEVVRRFPDLPFVLAHLAHEFVDDAVWMATASQNVYLDTCEARAGAVGRVLRGAPVHKILYGSDIPYHLPEVELAKIRLFPRLTDETLRAVLGGNARRLYWPETPRTLGADHAH